MKFRAEPIKQFADIGSKDILRPSGELAPKLLGLFPENFDHVEFLHPAQGKAVAQTMVNSCIAQTAQEMPDTRLVYLADRDLRPPVAGEWPACQW